MTEYILGGDFSHWNVPDWPGLAAAGHKFAYIKASEGIAWTDLRYAAHNRDATDVGLITGAYHYFRVAWPGAPQAAHFHDVATGPHVLPPAVDVEAINNAGFTQATARDRLLECLKVTEDKFGIRPMIYTSGSKGVQLIGTAPWAKDYDLWVADYGIDGKGGGQGIPRLPTEWATTGFKIWQFTKTPLDQDRMLKDYYDQFVAPPADEVDVRLPRSVRDELHDAIHRSLIT